MWVIGGNNSTGDKNDVWYSSDGVNWTRATDNAGWTARGDHTSVVFDNKMWVIGGWDNKAKNDVWYSSDGVNWIRATAAAGWSARASHTSVVFDNKMWVIGGWDTASVNDVWRLLRKYVSVEPTASVGVGMVSTGVARTIEGLNKNNYTVPDVEALADTTYYWRVRAVDGASNQSDWSEVWQFTVKTVPAPTLVSPRNYALVRDSTPLLDWSDVSDPNGVTYRVQVARDNAFSQVVYEKSGILPSQHELENPLQNGKYFWRVRAVDGAGTVGNWSSVWQFKLMAIEPRPLRINEYFQMT
jgi:hypothetical protein